MEKKFIIWDPRESCRPCRDESGAINTDGVLGRITEDNVYLRTYPRWPEGCKRLSDLEVGECITGVKYSLSGESGYYDVYRVE